MDYFTSDLHFNHPGAIGFDHRPFDSVEQMNDVLIRRWNDRVTERDTVYILGDLMWTTKRDTVMRILRSLNGHLILIRGNHDNRWLHGDEPRKRFMRIEDYLDLRIRMSDGTRKYFALSHYPIHFYNHAHHAGCMLYGHVHVSPEYGDVERIRQDLIAHGVPCEMYNTFCGLFNWAPATLEEVMAHQFDPGQLAQTREESRKPTDPNPRDDEPDDENDVNVE